MSTVASIQEFHPKAVLTRKHTQVNWLERPSIVPCYSWKQKSGRGFCVVTQVLWHINLVSRLALTCGYLSCTPPTSILFEVGDCIENNNQIYINIYVYLYIYSNNVILIGCVPWKDPKITPTIGYHLEMVVQPSRFQPIQWPVLHADFPSPSFSILCVSCKKFTPSFTWCYVLKYMETSDTIHVWYIYFCHTKSTKCR